MDNSAERRFVPEVEEPSFPMFWFLVSNAVQIVVWISLYFWLFPAAAEQELRAPWYQHFLWMQFHALNLSHFEYWFHRKVLHAVTFFVFARMFRAHKSHHDATNVEVDHRGAVPGELRPVKNKYAIEHKHQDVDRMFPWFSLSIFYALFLIPSTVIKVLCGALGSFGQPVILQTIVAVTVGYMGYELIHWRFHLPYERTWKYKLYESPLSWYYRFRFGPHLMHHLCRGSNESVWGFWTLPIWDWFYGTYKVPKNLPLPYECISKEDAMPPEPYAHTKWIDRCCVKLKRKLDPLEQYIAERWPKLAKAFSG